MKLMIGENLRRLRREKDITQEQLAEVLGVSDQSVSRWENDACYPDMELLPTMAKFFETSVDKLLIIRAEMSHRCRSNICHFKGRHAVSRSICISFRDIFDQLCAVILFFPEIHNA